MIKRIILALSLATLVVAALPHPARAAFNCSGVKISIDVNCPPQTDPAGPIIGYAKAIIRILTNFVAFGAVIAIIVGGILYMLSQGDQAKIKKAKTIIAGAIGGIVLLALFAAVVNFLIPGGVFIT